MKKFAHLLNLALVIPVSLIGAEAAFAYPCNRSTAVRGDDLQANQELSQSYYVVNPTFVSDSSSNGFIGVAIERLTPERAKEINQDQLLSQSIPEIDGVLVVRLLQNGPAELAGLAEGDILLGVDGQMVSRIDQVQQLIASKPVGEIVPVTFRRNGEVMTIGVTVGDGRILRGQMLQQ
jgi:S1-C subfamily serine protease